VKSGYITFQSEGRQLAGWLTLPAGVGPFPGIAMSGGFAAVKEHFLGHPYHEAFAAAGMATLLYDQPNCGESQGEPRQELDPVLQIRAYRDALTVLASHPSIDEDRLGIWGTSYSGGHVLVVAATDPRVRAVVSQVPTISGRSNLVRRHTTASYADLKRQWAEDRLNRASGGAPARLAAFAEGSDSLVRALGRPLQERERWVNELTVRSWELYDEYEPGFYVERICPRPLMMIVARHDAMTPAEDALAAFGRAAEPKRLVLLEGGHYAAYEQFELTSSAAADFFGEHL
jgi:fermentation-respiration switch protein FrsA (DUF1100 family)